MGLTAEQMNEVEAKYRMYKATYCFGLNVWDSTSILSDDEVAELDRRIDILRQVIKVRSGQNQSVDAGVIAHLIGDLQMRLKMNDQLKWNALPQAEKDRLNMVVNHPEWRVKSNLMLDMTGAIVEESQSTDVQVFQAAIVGTILAMAMPKPRRRSRPVACRTCFAP